mmetsp:Transcript_16830/g.19988  ORF Transcript_16830/g.19988 Transcript_16830/m.19988 type:complete len:202 (-) Transcript_16830:432-1037(-)
MLPHTNSTQTLNNNLPPRDTTGHVEIWIHSTVPPVIRAQRITHISIPFREAINPLPIIHILPRGKVNMVLKLLRHTLPILLKILTHMLRRHRPQLILHTIILLRQRPLHLYLNILIIIHHFRLDDIRVVFHNQKRGNINVTTGSIVRHNGFGIFADVVEGGRHAHLIRADADIVGDDNTGGTNVLGIADLLDEGAGAAVDH